MGLIFVGLDLETTGNRPNENCHACQVGLAAVDDWWVSDIGWRAGEYSVDAESLVVNRFTIGRIEAGPSAELVDGRAVEWLEKLPGFAARRVVPVGWNVAGYDVRYIRRDLPRLMSALSGRSVDLNAVCFTLSGLVGEGTRPGWAGLKRMSKRIAAERLAARGIDENHHDAGYDALAALESWAWLKDQIRR